jgi:glycosyltransferase involved in cell wall biosynthesis
VHPVLPFRRERLVTKASPKHALVTITILTRNRPGLLSIALESVLQQRVGDARLLVRVSDNSDNERTRELMAAEYPEVAYVRRPLGTSAADHFRAVIAEADSDFLVLFHDDDALHADYVARMLAEFEDDESLVAVGCNAVVVDGAGRRIRARWHRHRRTLRMCSPREVMVQYLPGGFGCAPLSSYMFRRSALAPAMINPALGGKYSDVAFVASVAERGCIAWIPDRLMSYRVHGGNDSGTFAAADHLLLAHYMESAGIDRRLPALRDFRRQPTFVTYLESVGKGSVVRPIVPSTRRDAVVQYAILRSRWLPKLSRFRIRLRIGFALFVMCERWRTIAGAARGVVASWQSVRQGS